MTKLNKLIYTVCLEYGITYQDLTGRDNTQPLPEARAVLSYLAVKEFKTTFKVAGHLSCRDKSTAIGHYKKIESDLKLYRKLRNKINRIQELMEPEKVNPYFHMYANLGKHVV